MATFVKIPFGEKGKHTGFFVLNTDRIRYMQYVEVNEAIPTSTVIEQVPYLMIWYGDGRQTLILDEEQALILLTKLPTT